MKFTSRIPEVADRELARRVRLFLEIRRSTVLRRLGIGACDGEVTLQGTLNSYYDRQVAIECVKRVAGVRQIVDLILVTDEEPCLTAQQTCCSEVLP